MPCIRTCMFGLENGLEEMRKQWDNWDLRILVLYILFTQLSLHVFGCHRKKSTSRKRINVFAWFLYLFSDLLATIALGKLSKVKGDNDDIKLMSLLRGLWAPIILFYLGGPDTMTVLRFEENHMWLKHAIGLCTLGMRTSYVLIVTWTSHFKFSLLALLMFFPGLIKYGERVWVIKSISEKKYVGLVQNDDPQKVQQTREIADAKKKAEGKRQIIEATAPPNAKLVLKAYSCFQTLKPHMSNNECDVDDVENLEEEFRELIEKEKASTTFKLIEIELGFMYDMHFSKVGSIFTAWGIILRLISLSCIVTVLVGFFLVGKPPGHLQGDVPITQILLVGALYLEIAGVLVQLGSDWAIVWAYKHYPSKLNTPVFHRYELVISKRKRWSKLMGQFSSVNNNKMVVGKTWTEVSPTLKELIISRLCKTWQKVSEVETSQALGPEVETSRASFMKRDEWTCGKYGGFDADWEVKLEFGESIVVWHVATDFCYQSETKNSKPVPEKEATKILSYYMMHLLVMRLLPLPFCNNTKKFEQAVKNYSEETKSANDTVKKLKDELMKKKNKWEIMSNVWIEMLCYAASCCSVDHHVQELRHGGQFLTHVWLLLMHLGLTKKQEKITAQVSTGKQEQEAELVNVSNATADITNNIIEQV